MGKVGREPYFWVEVGGGQGRVGRRGTLPLRRGKGREEGRRGTLSSC